MRYLFFILTMPAFFTLSCKKERINATIPQGTYKGTFQRSFLNNVSDVTIKFSANSFDGQSQVIHYPDICNGVFSINKDTASFDNSCIYTANFDWSYILEGKYKISNFGDSLIITREYNGYIHYYDTYKLKKQ